MHPRRSATALLIGFALVLAACGGGSSDATSDDGGSATTAAPSGSDTTADPGSDDDGGGDSGGDVDCAEISDAAQQMISIQLLAQLDSPETVESIKTNQIGGLDLDAFLEGMETLHQLDGYDNPLGNPKEAIDLYEDAAQQAQELFDADPPTQEAIDAYQESIGEPAEFLGHQTAIAGALDEAGC